jgi:anti-sigma factor RsiW
MQIPDDPASAQLCELDIHAYVDGALEARQAGRVGRYLGARPEEARRAAFYHRLNLRLRDGFPKLVHEPRDVRVAGALRRARRGRWRFGLAGGVLAAALGVLAGGWLAGSGSSSDSSSDNDSGGLAARGVMAFEQASAVVRMGPCVVPGDLRGSAVGNGLSTGSPDPALAAAGGASIHAACAALRRQAPDLAAAGFQASASTRVPLRFMRQATETVYRNAGGQAAVLLSVAAWGRPERSQWQAQRVGPLRVLNWQRGGRRYVWVGAAGTPGLMKAADLAAAGRADDAALHREGPAGSAPAKMRLTE